MQRRLLAPILIPRHTHDWLPVSTRNHFSRCQRQVYNLIDGHRSVHDIARILAKPYQHTATIIYQYCMLQIRGKPLVTLETPINSEARVAPEIMLEGSVPDTGTLIIADFMQ